MPSCSGVRSLIGFGLTGPSDSEAVCGCQYPAGYCVLLRACECTLALLTTEKGDRQLCFCFLSRAGEPLPAGYESKASVSSPAPRRGGAAAFLSVP